MKRRATPASACEAHDLARPPRRDTLQGPALPGAVLFVSALLVPALLVSALLVLVLLAPIPAQAAPLADYRLDSAAWNGLSSLALLAEHAGVALEQREAVELGDGVDVLLLVYPAEGVDFEAVTGWVAAGGSAIVADDFGASDEMLAAFGLSRTGAGPADRALQDAPALPLVGSVGLHPLSTGAPTLALNHPTGIRGPGLPVYAFADGTGVVYDMSMGTGTAVFVSDPSLLTNLMLPIEGNARFVHNTLRRTCPASSGCRAVLVAGGGSVSWASSVTSEPDRDWQERVHNAVRALQPVALREGATRAAALLLALGAAVLLWTIFPRRAPEWLLRHFELRPTRPSSAFEFNVRRFTRAPREPSMALPAALLRERFEAAFFPAIGRPPPGADAPPSGVDGALRLYMARYEPGASSARRRRVTRALRSLLAVPRRGELNVVGVPWVGSKEFLEWSRVAQTVLERIGDDERRSEYDGRTGAHP